MAEIKKTFQSVDGNTAAAMESYYFTEVAAIYPITPSSPMAELVDVMASKGQKNFFGSPVKVVEMQSEAGASGAVHGALQGGALATTYTASQGLLLMIPNLYKWCGELLPAVLHVSARSLASRSLSIFGDQADIYACRQTGVAMICSNSVQEIADLTPVAHLVAIECQVPVMHFFDGFRTSHEVQNVEFVDPEEWKKLLPMDKVEEFRKRALNPHGHAVTRGGAENDDIYFQAREAQNLHYDHVIEVAEKYFKEASRLTGREYAPFTYFGAKDATKVIIAMSYKHVYVAQIALGANPMKAIQALKEAESYNGPSLVICYCPCVNQGIKGGLVNSIKEEKDAVACGYFTTFRYDPRLLEQGKPALQLDCAEPDFTKLRDFVMTIFKAHYANAYIDLRIRLQKERILAALFLFIGFIFLGIHITFAAIKENSIYAEILDILGWVLVWEAGSVVFVNSIDDAAESHKLTLLFQAKTDEVSEAQSAPKAK